MTRYKGASSESGAATATGRTIKLMLVKSPLVFTRTRGHRMVSFVCTALCNAVVRSRRKPSLAIFRILLVPASPGAGSRYMPVRP